MSVAVHVAKIVSGAVLQHLQWLSVQLSGEDNLPVGLRQPARDLDVFPGSSPAKPWTDGTALLTTVCIVWTRSGLRTMAVSGSHTTCKSPSLEEET